MPIFTHVDVHCTTNVDIREFIDLIILEIPICIPISLYAHVDEESIKIFIIMVLF